MKIESELKMLRMNLFILFKKLQHLQLIKISTNRSIKEEVTREIRKHFELNENEKTTYQNLWHVPKAVLQGEIYSVKCFY